MKKTIIFYFFCVIATTYLVSCSNESTSVLGNRDYDNCVTEKDCDLIRKINSPKQIDISDAYNEVKGLYMNQFTRSGSTLELEHRVVTKSEVPHFTKEKMEILPDTLFYLFYSKNNDGYILVSADNRSKENILAINYKGNIDELDFKHDPQQALWIGYMIDNLYNSIKEYEGKRDSIQQQLFQKLYMETGQLTRVKQKDENHYGEDYFFDVIDAPVEDWSVSSQILPLIKTQWGQDWPFNEGVKDKIPGDSAVTGCVATATAQIVAYWRHPNTIHGLTFDWNQISERSYPVTQYEKERISMLMKFIGEDINMNYSPNGSSANVDDAYNWLINQGYSGIGSINYSTDSVKKCLYNKIPILISGYATKVDNTFLGITYNTYYEDGHAWIVDGYKELKRKRHQMVYAINKTHGGEQLIDEHYYYEYTTLLHNNWGWSGLYDGWFAAGNFDYKTPFSTTTRGNADNYQYELRIYPNIKP